MSAAPGSGLSGPGSSGPGPSRLVVVTGTGTGVGKTWVAASVARELRVAGRSVSARKPVQSFDASDSSTDVHVLAAATGEDRADVCSPRRWYEVAMAPPMAAELLGRPPFTVAELVDELSWPFPSPEIGLVEGVGGLLSPMASDGDTRSLVEYLLPDVVVVVADADLGAIHAVRACMEALDHGSHGAAAVVFLNNYDGTYELHRRNLEWFARRDGYEVLTTVPALAARLR